MYFHYTFSVIVQPTSTVNLLRVVRLLKYRCKHNSQPRIYHLLKITLINNLI